MLITRKQQNKPGACSAEMRPFSLAVGCHESSYLCVCVYVHAFVRLCVSEFLYVCMCMYACACLLLGTNHVSKLLGRTKPYQLEVEYHN